MEQETEKFIRKVEQKFKGGQVSITEFERLIKEWGQLIAVSCYEQHNMKQTYLNLNHLKFTVQWFKQQNADKSGHLQYFLDNMIQYIGVELESLTMYPEIATETPEVNGTQFNTMRWTTNKRSLIELICALKEAECINKGTIPLQKLVEHFGAIFGVDLKNYHQELYKIAARKPQDNSDDRAYFLNALAGKFNEKMLVL